jgi:hypothetical protein
MDCVPLELDLVEFLRYVQRTYLVGDTVTLHVLRNGARVELKMTFVR